ncbi:ATP-binding protein [Streptomyces sp. S1D4-11]|nr:HAMP domain-containing sensor histidine kinase [Streptomyces sp. S1D4-11]QIY99136.1 HAMP domain-containing histidine kinase [Streptomyces sp. S1D4-11]
MTPLPGRRPRWWRPHRLPIVLRLLIAVAAAMSVVLTGAAGLVYWRVEHALDQQLNEDLAKYRNGLSNALGRDGTLPQGPAGSLYQVIDAHGRITMASNGQHTSPLLTPAELRESGAGTTVHHDIGRLLPIEPTSLRLEAKRVRLPDGTTVVAVAAIQRGHRDEALRELLGQLALAAGLTLVAASYVGYRTARAALGPVERYRARAATLADGASGVRLPVPDDRDDELTRLGHTLNRMLDRLEAAAEREHRFIADASHELRTPLALLRAELDVALHRPRTAAELTDTLRAVDAEVQRLVDLSNALLDLEELGSTQHITRTPVGLADLVHATVDRHRDAAERDHRTLTADITPATISVDARWIKPALGNLLGNALRHGAGDIHLTAVVRDGRLRLAVADEGAGFPSSFLPQAFDRFSRAEASRTTPGSGLGLAFVAAVAASHDGIARAENTERGTVVTIEIPC